MAVLVAVQGVALPLAVERPAAQRVSGIAGPAGGQQERPAQSGQRGLINQQRQGQKSVPTANAPVH